MYAQINSIPHDRIESKGARKWLEARDDDERFVAVTDGDCSLIRSIEQQPLTLDQVLAQLDEGEEILVDDKSEAARTLAGQGLVRASAYYSGESLYSRP